MTAARTKPTKAILAGAVAFLGALAAATVTDNTLSLGELVTALSSTAVAVAAVYRVTNAPVDDE